MGLLSKLWKGVKKTVKKIGKGIKKVFKKIGGAIGKLGIVGQIGMMFLMPYATSALGSFFGASGKLATWSSKLLGKAGMGSKALGHTLNLINKAGTFAGNVYSSVTETINGAIDRTGNFLKGRGFVKTPVVSPDILAQGVDASQTLAGDGKFRSVLDKDGKVILDTGFDKAGFNRKALSDIQTNFKSFTPTESKNLLDLGTEDFAKAMTTDTKSLTASLTESGMSTVDSLLKPKEAGFLDKVNIFDKDSAIRKDIADMNIYETGKQYAKETVKESLVGGAKAGLTQQAAEAFGYKQPEGADYYSINLPEMMDAGYSSPSVFKEVDLSMQKSGNNFMVQNYQNSNYLNNLIGEGSSAYDSYMANFASSQYQPFKLGA